MKKILFLVIVLLLIIISSITVVLVQEKKISEFEKFNKSITNESIVFLAEGERDGPLLVQKIYSDHIEGLNFREYPIATNKGTPINLSIGQAASNGCTITLTLIGIENTMAKFSKKVVSNRPCPICLSGNTYIDTPNGSVYVKDLQEGMGVWTSDKSGSRHAAIILRTSKAEVPKDFQLVYLALDDGRGLFASPGHPLADGRVLGSIKEGDIMDDHIVVIARRIPYEGTYTYDILPSGDTGSYWANGIPVRSSLAASK
ncbi:MAG: Hint domain-containing protein [Candidatus Methanoperedens sp.]|nr:Hint domain-containing protein [Candidatus Methanoperedens sp.]MCZ7395063.1 Hint domain-containing protein [Candidatus Methanoperedens sp.]